MERLNLVHQAQVLSYLKRQLDCESASWINFNNARFEGPPSERLILLNRWFATSCSSWLSFFIEATQLPRVRLSSGLSELLCLRL